MMIFFGRDVTVNIDTHHDRDFTEKKTLGDLGQSP